MKRQPSVQMVDGTLTYTSPSSGYMPGQNTSYPPAPVTTGVQPTAPPPPYPGGAQPLYPGGMAYKDNYYNQYNNGGNALNM